jgi:hypothetical protein
MRASFVPEGPIKQIVARLETFYAEMQVRFPASPTATQELLSFSATFSLTCAKCTKTILSGVKVTPTATDFCATAGFMAATHSDKGEFVLIVKSEERKAFAGIEGQSQWADSESIAFRTLSCACGAIIGCRIHAASKRDEVVLDDMRLVIDRLYAAQGKQSVPLEAIVQKPKVLQMRPSDGGQLRLNFS